MITEPALRLAAEIYGATFLIIVSLSHILAPALWCRLFQDALKHPAAGLILGFLTLMFGLPILVVHWRWIWDLRAIITILAWGSTIKGTLYLLFPALPSRVAAAHIQHPPRFVAAGVVGVLLGALVIVGIVSARVAG